MYAFWYEAIAGHVERIDAELLLREHGALVEVRVITILASWSITTMPTLQAATRSHGTQSNATKAEDGAVFQSDFGQWNEQYQRLECHAQRPRACGQGDFAGGPKIKRMLGGTAE